ncbi:MAG: hypothetical protein M1368_08380, partial [Thaumarchaeota archaeon]|nr:hypothetical protein [Nitrososphaerota archaeon]
MNNSHRSQAAESHKHASPEKLKLALFTISSSRYRETKAKDESGEIALELCTKAGHECVREILDEI